MSDQTERERLIQRYRTMDDGELEQIAAEAPDLTEAARELLEKEILRRGIAVEIAVPEPAAPSTVDDELVTIRQFRDLHAALLAQGTLQASGIQCFIADDNMVRLDWFISNLLGGVKIRVRKQDIDIALDVLEQNPPEAFDVEGVGTFQQPQCPTCGSLDTSYVMAPSQLKCETCGHGWNDPSGDGEP